MRLFRRLATLRGDVDVDYAVPCAARHGFDCAVPQAAALGGAAEPLSEASSIPIATRIVTNPMTRQS